MKEPREPYIFPCMDDSPFNNGYGYNQRELTEEEIEEPEPGDDEDE